MHIFFDLDHTLWDFDHNAEICLKRIFAEHLVEENAKLYPFLKSFKQVNRHLWHQLEKNLLTHDYLRKNRFKQALDLVGISVSQAKGETMNKQFLQLLPLQTCLMPHTIETLNYLKPRHSIHILSNGFYDIQKIKIRNSGLEPYVQELITNDIAGAKKPHPNIFSFALKKTKARLNDSVMIGDSYEADINGAEKFGLRSIYFSPENTEKHHTHITSLAELKDYL